MIRYATAAAALLAAAAPALADDRAFPVGGFERLATGGSADVSVVTGGRPGVRATGSAAALDRLDIRVEGDTLKIGTKRGLDWSWRDHGRVHIAVTVPMLRAVDLAGSGSVDVDHVRTAAFDGQISGSGALSVAVLDVDTAQFGIAGSGNVTAAGRCGAGRASIAGSGRLRLAALKCATFSADVAGSGSVDAFATQTANLSIMGSGNVNLTGGARCTVSSAGTGKAHCS